MCTATTFRQFCGHIVAEDMTPCVDVEEGERCKPASPEPENFRRMKICEKCEPSLDSVSKDEEVKDQE